MKNMLMVSDVGFAGTAGGNQMLMAGRLAAFATRGYRVFLCLAGEPAPGDIEAYEKLGASEVYFAVNIPASKVSRRFYRFVRDKSPESIRRLVRRLRGFERSDGETWPSNSPADLYDPELADAVASLCNKLNPDLLYVQYLYLGYVLDNLNSGAIKIVETHDLLHRLDENYREHGHENTAYIRISKEEEARELAKFDVAIALTEQDRQTLDSMSNGTKCIICAPSNPLNRNAMESIPERKRGQCILFLGARHPANVYGLEAFIDNCWEKIHCEHPKARLLIGGTVGREFENRDVPGMEILGFVDDLDALYRRSDIVISPIFFGTGIKIKVQEALCMGKACVISKESLPGFEAGRSAFLVADDVEDFVRHIHDLFDNPERISALEDAALNYCKACLGFERSIEPLISLIEAKTSR